MNLTLLIDMDDTLLKNPLEKFMPAYLKLIGEALSSKIDPNQMIPQMLKATDKMIAKQDFRGTLESHFDNNFYPVLGLEKNDVSGLIDRFYAKEYRSLQQFTNPLPDAVQLVKKSLNNGFTVVVATNPLFPQKAMRERLTWANLPIDKVPFSLITSYENFHFAKPNPAYYAEILAQLGWPEQPVCMIGNSLSEDIQPAEKLGISTYWITEKSIDSSGSRNTSVYGSFEKAISWIESVAAMDSFSLDYSSPESILAFLKSTPAALDTILKQADPLLVNRRPGADEWSVLEIICHLRDVENEVNLPRFRKIVLQGETFIAAVDSDNWAKEREYQKGSLQKGFYCYSDARSALIDLVQNLDNSLLNHTVNHSIFGPTKVLELLQFIIYHDQDHIRQIKKTLSKFYTIR